MKNLLIGLFLFISLCVFSQNNKSLTKIYVGENTNYVTIIYTIDNEHVYRESTIGYLSILYSFTSDYICKGTNANYVYRTYDLFREDGVIKTKDGIKLYHIKDNRIFNSINTNRENCLYTIDEEHLYSGWSTNYQDILYSFKGTVDIYLIACLLGGY